MDGTHILVALGVDELGHKTMLGLSAGSSENAHVVKAQLTSLRDRGLAVNRDCLFVIDGGKALHSAIDKVLGEHAKVQRCRTHSCAMCWRRCPRKARSQTKSVRNAAYKLAARRGLEKIRQQAKWLRAEYVDAAASMLEGLEEVFTVNKLGLPPSLTRSLCTPTSSRTPTASCERRPTA